MTWESGKDIHSFVRFSNRSALESDVEDELSSFVIPEPEPDCSVPRFVSDVVSSVPLSPHEAVNVDVDACAFIGTGAGAGVRFVVLEKLNLGFVRGLEAESLSSNSRICYSHKVSQWSPSILSLALTLNSSNAEMQDMSVQGSGGEGSGRTRS